MEKEALLTSTLTWDNYNTSSVSARWGIPSRPFFSHTNILTRKTFSLIFLWICAIFQTFRDPWDLFKKKKKEKRRKGKKHVSNPLKKQICRQRSRSPVIISFLVSSRWLEITSPIVVETQKCQRSFTGVRLAWKKAQEARWQRRRARSQSLSSLLGHTGKWHRYRAKAAAADTLSKQVIKSKH